MHQRSAPDLASIIDWAALPFLILIVVASAGTFVRFGVLTPAWFLIYAGTLVIIMARYREVTPAIKHAWPVFLFCAFAMLSTIWSADAARTLYASFQLFFTALIAAWIASRFTASQIFTAMLLGTGIGVGLSLLMLVVPILEPFAQGDYVGAPRYFVGIYDQKNVVGKALDLVTISVLYVGIRHRRPLLSFAIALMLFIPLKMSQSAGSLMVYLVMLGFPMYWLLVRNPRMRPLILASLSTLGVMLLIIVLAADFPIVTEVLDAFGKDDTLTGRTAVWATGMGVLDDRILMGVGYDVFWSPGLFQEVTELQKMMHGQLLNSLHNSYVEMLVSLGFIGLILYVIVLLLALFRCLAWFLRTTSLDAFGMLVLLLSFLFLTAIESVMTKQHTIHMLILFTLVPLAKLELMRHDKQVRAASKETEAQIPAPARHE